MTVGSASHERQKPRYEMRGAGAGRAARNPARSDWPRAWAGLEETLPQVSTSGSLGKAISAREGLIRWWWKDTFGALTVKLTYKLPNWKLTN